ncbi:hypothetical protein Ae201684P_006338 [Aphanomyces euteiches]|uniref:Uncharacterized protein n=1 Tax=Aphanomyces euteiches TaxID=100861 RepID=A0A6G0XBN2_9STRA|nr:hypothetical protein Ae201684_006638 [Aphanomyces euteiches]KAH9090934.1 hypothetical protein Ae201684P_006338 [Aphanomyces euteiches]KAH9132151.1 hypothetical protein AeRB84_021354 [Aphanomyces euteiches]
MNALEPKFQTPPDILSNPKTKTADRFLENFTNVCGPVFIVLDEIGAAFSADDLNDLEQRKTFLSFCSNVVGKWLWLPKVFFVLVGRGSFLTYVGRRPEDLKLSSRMHMFERLKLDLLREDAIEEILENTWISTELSLWDYFGLNNSTAKTVAKHLFDQTNGHPRSLFHALVQSKSLEDLLRYEGAFPLQGLNLVKFYDDSVRHKEQVLLLLEAAETQDRVNMLQLIPDRGERAVSLDVIANKSCVDWEGTAEEARVYIHPMVKSYLEGWLMPLAEYIEYIGKSLKVSVDYPNAFEWMFIKRFQQAFSVKSQPRLVMPEFFDSPIFGSCDDLAFSTFTQPMPKITSNGSRFPNLHSSTASPDRWKVLLDRIALLGDVCLKPLPKSASSDAFLVTKARFRGKEVKVVCGLAVKNYAKTPFTDNDLSKECDVFDRMFNRIDSTGYLRVLFVCCTSYDKDMSSKFKGKSHFVYQCKKSFPNIDEAILLNLETPKQRAAFFGVEDDLAPFVEVVVRKAEVGYSVT